MSELISYFNGSFVPDNECKVHVFDRGFRYGDAVFDIQRTFGGKPFRIKEHLARLSRSLKYARLNPNVTLNQWEELTLEVLRLNENKRLPGGDLYVGQYVSRGRSHHVLDKVPLTVCIRSWHVEPNDWVQGYMTGIHGVIVRSKSYPHQAMDSKVKHNNRLNFALAQLEATDVDPEAYPILTDDSGSITESIQANVVIVKEGVIKSPRSQTRLQGDSLRMVRELSNQLSIPLVEEDLQPYDLYTADEIFFTNSAYCIMPVSKIDGRKITDHVPGPITAQLQAAWSEFIGMDFVDQAINYESLQQQI